ncbi:hypothetical protein LZK98_11960 [Sphingomonas cannabina]|uniref:hypothetical protein n=1 Tax=Sphingomonas cannabina TaxID=2899123 RepID=UPI001F1CC5BA|nr:hypothetical protein [Sphingomonas cannabina]UIJ43807.1 hypothetical protein LZK98_11960 [Sphingomonas cannabina]
MIPFESALNAAWAWLGGNFKLLLIVAGLVLASFFLGQCDGRSTQRAKDMDALNRAAIAAQRIVNKANEWATAQMLKDQQRIADQDKERLDAITSAPKSGTGAATRALGCVRLRQNGLDREADAAGCAR